MSRSPATVRVARWSATHPWRAIALWLVFVATCVALGSATELHKASDIDFATGQSKQAEQWVRDAGLERPDTENVLVTARDGRLDTTAGRAALDDIAQRMRGLDEVAEVGRPATSPKRDAMTVAVTLRKSAEKDAAPLVAVTEKAQDAHPDLRIEQVGTVSLDAAVNDLVDEDLGAASMISTPVTILILLVAFGAILAAGVPVLLALSAVGAATGLSTLVSHFVPDSGSTSAMILLMGMAVGVDYSLFYVKRAREERRAGRTTLDAVEIAAETSGHSVLVSGAAVMAAMLGLFLADDAIFNSLATGSLIVVAIAVLSSLTVLPAVLVKLGSRIDRPRVPVLWRLTAQHRTPVLWPAILRPSLERPRRTLAISVLVLGALAVPALSLQLESGSLSSLPSSLAEKHAAERLNAAFDDQQAETTVVVRSSGDADYRLRAIAADPRLTPLFGSGEPDIRSAGDVHVLTLVTSADAESDRARDGVRTLRGGVMTDHLTRATPWAVGGETATKLDNDDHLADRLPWVVGFVVLLTMLIMGWVFRSVVIALVTAAMNLLSAGVSFGVLVVVFQHSWAESLLGFESTGRVVNWIPLFTFAVLFGLSMDYHVFVLSRIREAAARGLSTREAIREGIVGSAGTVTSAALIMVSVFAIFAALHLVEMKELGVALAVAVLVDAVIVRGVVLPSLLMLLGDRAWSRRDQRRWSGQPAPLRRSVDSAYTLPQRARSGAQEQVRPRDGRLRRPAHVMHSLVCGNAATRSALIGLPQFTQRGRLARSAGSALLLGKRHRPVHLGLAVEQGHLRDVGVGELVEVLAEPALGVGLVRVLGVVHLVSTRHLGAVGLFQPPRPRHGVHPFPSLIATLVGKARRHDGTVDRRGTVPAHP